MSQSSNAHPPLNLALDQWIPVRRRGGRLDTIAPWQVTDGLDGGDPVVAFAWPRADFDGASHEFLIGLLATTFAPHDDFAWREFWDNPPLPDVLRERFQSVAEAFVLDGDGSRFMQDMDELVEGKEKSVAQLLIDTPGEKTIEDNTDHFVKRDQIAILGRPAAAMALFTLQTYAPSGGRGHLTSLRGGGPMTTLAIGQHASRSDTTLWDRLWPNVETQDTLNERRFNTKSKDLAAIFPWMAPAPVRGSNSKAGGDPVNPKTVDPLQVYWAMPRRVRLSFEHANQPSCDLTRQADPFVVRNFRTQTYGMDYLSEGFSHPLSPYYCQKPGGPRLPLHPQPGGMSYRDWVGLLVNDAGGGKFPAAAISAVQSRRQRAEAGETWRLVAFGYDMDNMKARGWVQSESHIPSLSKLWTPDEFERAVNRLIKSADVAGEALVSELMSALFKNTRDIKKKRKEPLGYFSFVAERFWRETESDFHHVLNAVRAVHEAEPDNPDLQIPYYENWASLLRSTALALFDEQAPLDTSGRGDTKRAVIARNELSMTFWSGRAFFEKLDIVSPALKKSRATAKEKA